MKKEENQAPLTLLVMVYFFFFLSTLSFPFFLFFSFFSVVPTSLFLCPQQLCKRDLVRILFSLNIFLKWFKPLVSKSMGRSIMHVSFVKWQVLALTFLIFTIFHLMNLCSQNEVPHEIRSWLVTEHYTLISFGCKYHFAGKLI